ncbi:hypothetical protein [Chryseolinea sp. H1M3-3]|uniref:hypothetical protein n=1 Tax=Chryseolinea sp. H1M3-3 TaxID=3034144 RepID=UPI0023ECFDA6|nr:hypothetical protein [Chryseolinea sp. H1M3-3]
MKELHEFRIYEKYSNLLFQPDEGKKTGIYRVIEVERDDPKFEQIRALNEKIKRDHNDFLFLYSNVKRVYTEIELRQAVLFHIELTSVFEPAGEECGTKYDEASACDICGANRRQIGPLILKKGTVPKKDIACTIAGEIVVSKHFAESFIRHNLKGLSFDTVIFGKQASDHYQLIITSPELSVTKSTIAGNNVFDLGSSSEMEIYRCPKGHTIGLNLVSEVFLANNSQIGKYDFFATKEKVGINRGLLRPQPLYLCSSAFKRMVEKEKITGLTFEVAHIER